jgi:hypothetical protein
VTWKEVNKHVTRKTNQVSVLRIDEERVEGFQEDHDHGAEEVKEVQVM